MEKRGKRALGQPGSDKHEVRTRCAGACDGASATTKGAELPSPFVKVKSQED